MKIGRIEVVCGSMFSGKSEELLRRLNRATIAKRKFQLFKPTIDDRYSKDEVVSHSGQKMVCVPLSKANQILEFVEHDTQIVAIDEAQFYDSSLIPTVLELTRRGKRVICAGLDMDSNGMPFGPMPQLLAMAEEVVKLTAVCEVCGEPATHTYRKSNQNSQVLVGAVDHYEARCREHWDGL